MSGSLYSELGGLGAPAGQFTAPVFQPGGLLAPNQRYVAPAFRQALQATLPQQPASNATGAAAPLLTALLGNVPAQAGLPVPAATTGGVDAASPAPAAAVAPSVAGYSGEGSQGDQGPANTNIGGVNGRSALVGALSHVAPGVFGGLLGLGNAANGAMAGVAQGNMLGNITGVQQSTTDQIANALAGATGMSGLSGIGHGLGGYGDIGIAGPAGNINMADPGVAGARGAVETQAGLYGGQAPGASVNANMFGGGPDGAGGTGQGDGNGGASGLGGGGGGAETGADMNGNAYAAGGVAGGLLARGVQPHKGGLIAGNTPGRADALHGLLPRGAYVVPADVVSALGEGNTNAGAHALDTRLPGKAQGGGYARGGVVHARVSGGEYVVNPARVAQIGGGDAAQGQKLLDHLVQKTRGDNVKTLGAMPGPQ